MSAPKSRLQCLCSDVCNVPALGSHSIAAAIPTVEATGVDQAGETAGTLTDDGWGLSGVGWPCGAIGGAIGGALRRRDMVPALQVAYRGTQRDEDWTDSNVGAFMGSQVESEDGVEEIGRMGSSGDAQRLPPQRCVEPRKESCPATRHMKKSVVRQMFENILVDLLPELRKVDRARLGTAVEKRPLFQEAKSRMNPIPKWEAEVPGMSVKQRETYRSHFGKLLDSAMGMESVMFMTELIRLNLPEVATEIAELTQTSRLAALFFFAVAPRVAAQLQHPILSDPISKVTKARVAEEGASINTQVANRSSFNQSFVAGVPAAEIDWSALEFMTQDEEAAIHESLMKQQAEFTSRVASQVRRHRDERS